MTMRTIKPRSRIGDDGILHLDVPTGLTNTRVDVVVVPHPDILAAHDAGKRSHVWQDLIQRTAGSIPDLEEPDSEGDFEVREPIA
jgi:hypothetical protein